MKVFDFVIYEMCFMNMHRNLNTLGNFKILLFFKKNTLKKTDIQCKKYERMLVSQNCES